MAAAGAVNFQKSLSRCSVQVTKLRVPGSIENKYRSDERDRLDFSCHFSKSGAGARTNAPLIAFNCVRPQLLVFNERNVSIDVYMKFREEISAARFFSSFRFERFVIVQTIVIFVISPLFRSAPEVEYINEILTAPLIAI